MYYYLCKFYIMNCRVNNLHLIHHHKIHLNMYNLVYHFFYQLLQNLDKQYNQNFLYYMSNNNIHRVHNFNLFHYQKIKKDNHKINLIYYCLKNNQYNYYNLLYNLNTCKNIFHMTFGQVCQNMQIDNYKNLIYLLQNQNIDYM